MLFTLLFKYTFFVSRYTRTRIRRAFLYAPRLRVARAFEVLENARVRIAAVISLDAIISDRISAKETREGKRCLVELLNLIMPNLNSVSF